MDRVEARMPLGQLRRCWLVVWMRSLAPRFRERSVDLEAHDDALRQPSLGAGSSLDECDDCLVHVGGGIEVAAMHTELAAAVAHHHVAIAREAAVADARETQRLEALEQLFGVARRSLRLAERKRELHRRDARGSPAAPKHRLQRLKHFTGPATKLR